MIYLNGIQIGYIGLSKYKIVTWTANFKPQLNKPTRENASGRQA